MSVAQILSGSASGVAGSLVYAGIFTAAAATSSVYLPGQTAPVSGNGVALTTLFQTAPLPVLSTPAASLGRATAGLVARTLCIPLGVTAPATNTPLNATGGLPAGAAANETYAFVANATNAGRWLLLVWQ